MDEILHLNGKPKGFVFAVSAPSGTGKTTLCSMLSVEFDDIKPSISYTTRTKREGERDGVSYYFINDAEFDKMIEKGEFIEWANIFGKRYGTAYKSVIADSNSLFDMLLEIDVQGVERLIKIYRGIKNANKLVTVFITPPSYSDLQTRLLKRGGMSEEELNCRINIAAAEVEKSGIYDYVITNDDLDEAYLKLKSIVIAERCRNKFKLD
ncbi:MAG TPA: guanylate kinase [bacterium]|nr:guanylate kinase [bacterium]